MAEIRTRDEALSAVDSAIAQWASASTEVLARATTSAGAAQSEADAEVSRRDRRVAELTGVLAMLRDDEPLKAVVAADLARARDSLEAGRRAAASIAGVAARVLALRQSQVRNTQSFAEAARADLARRGGQLGAYRAAGAGTGTAGLPGGEGAVRALGGLALGGAGAAASGPARNGSGGGGGTGASWLAERGLSDVDVAVAGFADNPIVGKFGRGDLTRADYRWAVATWDEVIRPGLDRGMTRDDFAARDAANGTRPLRRYADVYDLFLGSDCIRVERRADGTLDVTGGRHRLEVARELGVPRLPAKWGGR